MRQLFRRFFRRTAEPTLPLPKLRTRDRILRLLHSYPEGLTTKEMSIMLGVSTKAAHSARASLMRSREIFPALAKRNGSVVWIKRGN